MIGRRSIILQLEHAELVSICRDLGIDVRGRRTREALQESVIDSAEATAELVVERLGVRRLSEIAKSYRMGQGARSRADLVAAIVGHEAERFVEGKPIVM
jgi:hypothetical protein